MDKWILTILPARRRRSSGSSPLLLEGLHLEVGAAGGAAATVAAATAENIHQL